MLLVPLGPDMSTMMFAMFTLDALDVGGCNQPDWLDLFSSAASGHVPVCDAGVL